MKPGKIITTIGIIFIAAAVLLTSYNIADQLRAEKAAESTASTLRQEIEELKKIAENQKEEEETQKENTTGLPDENFAQIQYKEEETTAETSTTAEADETVDIKTFELNGEEYVGIISLPSIGIELPVYAECTTEKLKTAPCAEYGSLTTGDFVICAHNYRGHFGKIGNLRIGDSVVFTDVEGNTYNFYVAEQETLKSTDVEAMKTSGYPLTLYTCTLDGNRRVTVRCDAAG